MYEIEISKKELDTIVVALRDSEERLREQCKTLHCSYFDLPDNMKFIWRDKKAYDKYTENAIKDCCRQLDEICALQEKLDEL